MRKYPKRNNLHSLHLPFLEERPDFANAKHRLNQTAENFQESKKTAIDMTSVQNTAGIKPRDKNTPDPKRENNITKIEDQTLKEKTLKKRKRSRHSFKPSTY